MSDYFGYQQQPQAPQASAPAPAGFSAAPAGFSEGFTPQAPLPAPQQPAYQGQGYAQSPAPSQAPAPAPAASGYGGNSAYGSGSSGGYSGAGGRSGGFGGGGGGGRGGFNGGGFQKPPLTQAELDALVLPKAAAITGNYNAPEQVIPLIQEAVQLLRQHGYKIRISQGKGFDDYVGRVVGPSGELYLPWKFKNDNGSFVPAFSTFNGDECKEFTRRYVPDWGAINEKQQAFWFKVTRMVLGKNCREPAQLSIIWSEDGVESPQTRTPKSGQAGLAAALSRAMNIPVFNLNNPNALQRLKQYLEGTHG